MVPGLTARAVKALLAGGRACRGGVGCDGDSVFGGASSIAANEVRL